MNSKLRALVLTSIVLASILATAGIGAAQEHDTETSAATNATGNYVIEQGDQQYQVEPLESGETIEEFYDYRNHQTHPDDVERDYSSHGTPHLQADDTTILFLHEGPNGLSLVMVHDQLNGETEGGVADFEITGLPADSEWVVKNDDYDSDTNIDEFDRGDGWASASWIWREGRTGGGAIQGGLDDEFSLTIDPAYNDNARFSDEDEYDHPEDDFYDDGEIDSIHVLSGDADTPDRIPLDSLDEPITIRSGAPDSPSVAHDRTDDGVHATVADATEDDRIELQPTHGSGDSVTFDRLSVTGIEDETSFEIINGHPETPSPSPDGVDSASHLTVTSDDDGEYDTTVEFTVNKTWLDDNALEPEELTLYTEGDAGWNETATAVAGETDTTYQYSANVTTPAALTVAPSQEAGDDTPFVLYGLGGGLAAGVVLSLGWMLNAKRRST